ncbi:MAG: hypothetical protein HFE47_03030 [Clostridia bacterium]|nr:hypothetical protein [Clostridia bacterium]
MKKKCYEIICALLAVACAFSFVACTDDKPTPPPQKVKEYHYYDYTPVHESDTRLLKFYTSDERVSTVLNDYNERHMRYNEETQIHDHPVGAGGSDWKEWEAMSGSWWNTNEQLLGSRYATQSWVNDWLTRKATFDVQGYVYPDQGGRTGWGLGWDFPRQGRDGEGYFRDFDTDAGGWTGLNGTRISVSDSVLTASVTASDAIMLESGEIATYAFGSPFIQLFFGVNIPEYSKIDDLYIQFRTASEPEYDTTFDGAKTVKFSEFCLQGYALDRTGANDMTVCFFPMYLLESWGKAREEILQYRVILKAKEGQKLTGSMRIDWTGCEWDGRHIINNCNYLIAAKEMVSFSQDLTLLRSVMERARTAMNFLYYQMNGKSGLISTEYFVGHDNRESTMNYGIGSGYWDMSAFPDVNMYTNISYYRALQAMLYLEEMCAANKIIVPDVYTRNEQMNGKLRYELTAEELRELIPLCKERFGKEFWNEKTGRFHAGTMYNGKVQDVGYLMFNQQAIVAGLATAEQEKSIISWINGERTVQGDASTGDDIYLYEFAPRFCTATIAPHVFWAGIGAFGTNVNNGGTALHLAYYDMVSQARVDIDKAGERLETFVKWYHRVLDAWKTYDPSGYVSDGNSKPSWEFYRHYYGTDVKLQGGGSGGVIGLDYEFLEASLFVRAVPDAFFGWETQNGNTLKIAPDLPDSLEYIRMENVTYGGNYCDISVGHWFATVSGVSLYSSSGIAPDAMLQVEFDIPAFDYVVEVNGETSDDYVAENGKLVVRLPFGNARVEIKKA